MTRNNLLTALQLVLLVILILIAMSSIIEPLRLALILVIAVLKSIAIFIARRLNMTAANSSLQSAHISSEGEVTQVGDDSQVDTATSKEENEVLLARKTEERKIKQALQNISRTIPLLTGQLKGVIDFTDDAAMTLSESFFGMNSKAKNQAEAINRIFGALSAGTNVAEGESELGSGLLEIKKNLGTIFSGLDSLSGQIRENSESIKNIFEKTSEINKLIADTSVIADDSRVLSINASVEAARAGESGRGFSVVATEFKKLTERSDEYSKKIGETVGLIINFIENAQRDLQKSENISRDLDKEARESSEASLLRIDTMISNLRSALESVSEMAAGFTKDISKVIYSIQFQDISRQRIEHVIEPLERFATDIDTIADVIENLERSDDLDQLMAFDGILDELRKKYTMESERELLKEHTSDKVTDNED